MWRAPVRMERLCQNSHGSQWELAVSLPHWMLAYLRRPAKKRKVGQRKQGVINYLATQTSIYTHTCVCISPGYNSHWIGKTKVSSLPLETKLIKLSRS